MAKVGLAAQDWLQASFLDMDPAWESNTQISKPPAHSCKSCTNVGRPTWMPGYDCKTCDCVACRKPLVRHREGENPRGEKAAEADESTALPVEGRLGKFKRRNCLQRFMAELARTSATVVTPSTSPILKPRARPPDQSAPPHRGIRMRKHKQVKIPTKIHVRSQTPSPLRSPVKFAMPALELTTVVANEICAVAPLATEKPAVASATTRKRGNAALP